MTLNFLMRVNSPSSNVRPGFRNRRLFLFSNGFIVKGSVQDCPQHWIVICFELFEEAVRGR